MIYSKALAYKFGGCDAEDLAQELEILCWQKTKEGVSAQFIPRRMKWYACRYYRDAIRRRAYWAENLESGVIHKPVSEKLAEPFRALVERIAAQIPWDSRQVFHLMAAGYTVREISKRRGLARMQAWRERERIKKILVDKELVKI